MHKLVRTGVAAAGLAAALALTGCGSGDDPADKDRGESSAVPSGATGGGSGGSSGSGGAKAADLEGTWAGLGKSQVIALSVKDGHATLLAGQHVCNGAAKDGDKVTLSLKCTDGDTERTSGSVESNDGKTVVVSWSTGAKDTLTKTEPGDGFPSGLPTGLPTELPTPLPTS
ncbi:hypothetical protein ACFU5O_22020 [Streptomyces sp. NPDC057445]|uniref:hypothetical protein n=1 Tax=Streptomyces sp. NPDC057445 TaxID=3346136 RepID=UPI00367CE5D0